ncbi:hypothetical protein [Serratia nevei]|uniref:hypothetical protein n=1 Tax=Serratia nevei TaxID=2703794 RepID=UPI00313E53E7
MGAAKAIGRFIPVANIRLIFAEILRDFSAAGRGNSFCLLCWYFLFYWFFILTMCLAVFLYSVKSLLLAMPFFFAVTDSIAIDSVAV